MTKRRRETHFVNYVTKSECVCHMAFVYQPDHEKTDMTPYQCQTYGKKHFVKLYNPIIVWFFLPIGSLAPDFQTMRVYTFGNRSYKRESRVVYSYDLVNRIEMFAHDFADWLSQLCHCFRLRLSGILTILLFKEIFYNRVLYLKIYIYSIQIIIWFSYTFSNQNVTYYKNCCNHVIVGPFCFLSTLIL